MKKSNQNVVNNKVIKQCCHAKLDLESSTQAVYKQQQQALKILNQVQDDFIVKKAHGFTLIELLVVVLIIGILAAVAVPQYQKAVYKSRAMEAVSMLKAITEAEEVYYLANNEYTDDISKLDVNVPTELIQETFSIALFENKYSYSCARKMECAAKANNDNLPDFQFNFRTGRTDADAGKFYCNLGSEDNKTDIAKSICQSMGRLDETRTQEWAIGKYFIIN